jgi:hypothetical protein
MNCFQMVLSLDVSPVVSKGIVQPPKSLKA